MYLLDLCFQYELLVRNLVLNYQKLNIKIKVFYEFFFKKHL